MEVIAMKKIITLVLMCCLMLTGSIYATESRDTNMPNFDFKVDPNNIEGSLTELMDYLKWFNAHLDETNVKYLAWGDSIVDNVDATHKLKLKFYIPDGVLKVQKLTLNFSVEAFRAYEIGAVAGGDGTYSTSSEVEMAYGGHTDADGGSHSHSITNPGITDYEDISHTHGFSVTFSEHSHSVTLPTHAHGILYGIFESTSAAGSKVYVDGTLRLNNGGAGYSTDQANLDLTQWVSTSGWHTIEISSSQLGRINAAYFMQVYVGANGI
jgi:hypothetical protein